MLEILELHQAQLSKLVGKEYETTRWQLTDQARKNRDQAIAAVLTPEEFVDYQLRLSETATKLRFALDTFGPNEQEFRAIFRLQKEFDDEFGFLFSSSGHGNGIGPVDTGPADYGVTQEKHAEASKALNEKIKNALGEQRFLDHQRSQDAEYGDMS